MKLTDYQRGLVTMAVDSMGRIFLSDHRTKAGGIPNVHISLSNSSDKPLRMVMNALGVRKALNFQKSKMRYNLILSESVTHDLLKNLHFVTRLDRIRIGLEIIEYKRDQKIVKDVELTEEQTEILEKLMKDFHAYQGK